MGALNKGIMMKMGVLGKWLCLYFWEEKFHDCSSPITTLHEVHSYNRTTSVEELYQNSGCAIFPSHD